MKKKRQIFDHLDKHEQSFIESWHTNEVRKVFKKRQLRNFSPDNYIL